MDQRFQFVTDALSDRPVLVNSHIRVEKTDDGRWAIYCNTVLIATLDERDFIIRG